jgi:hypothetical protein
MIPKRGQSQAPFTFVSPRTTPDTADWKYRTNNTCLVDRYHENRPAPAPATLTWDFTTPVSKSGTLIQDDGNGGRERAISQMQKKKKNPK